MLPKVISLGFLGIGVFLLVQVVMPFITFKSWEIFALDKNQMLVNPIPKNNGNVLGVSVKNLGDFPAFYVNGQKVASYRDFKLTVPSINLYNSQVLINSNDFEKSLGHLPGTALPGERGNVFVTGHSSLPANIIQSGGKAFFVNLPKIKKGDEIYVETPGQLFTYVVEGIKVVDPKDVSVINPPDNEGRYLTLMTCVPPGYNIKRLIVLARLK
jgi:LPXTG-site transpeptidase (sortase) family protein